MASYGITEAEVTAVTTDTAANQKNAIMKHTDMEWLPCICHVMELVMGVMMRSISEVLDSAMFRSFDQKLSTSMVYT